MLKVWKFAIPALVIAGVAWAAAPGIINQYNALCSADFPTRCVEVTASGEVPVSGSVSTTTEAEATAAAPSYVEGTANPLSMDLSGGLRITGTINASSSATATAAAPTYGEGVDEALSQNLTGDLRTIAKQSGTWNITNVSGTVSLPTGAATAANQQTDALTDTQLRATPVPISGTVTVTDGAGALNVIVDSSALPTGAATAAKQPALGTAGTASTDVITVQGIAAMTPLLATVTGTVTANAGTNLNTSALALESGGNLATLAGTVTSSRAAVNPIVGQAGIAGGTGVDGATVPRVTLATNVGLPAGTAALGTVGVTAAQTGLTPVVSGSAGTGLVLKASSGVLWGLEVTSGAAAGYVMIHNSATVPAAGAVTPRKCYVLPANSTVGIDFRPGPPVAFSTGISVSFSTTGCFTQTDSATAFISGEVQ